MTHYQKLAAMIFRIIGLLLLIIGITFALMSLITMFGGSDFAAIVLVIFYSLPFTILGILLFTLSQKLGKWICYDFER